MAKNDRHVAKNDKGWAVKKGSAPKPESVHSKQSGTETPAKDTVRRLGGGEVRIQIQNRRGR